MTLTLEEPPQTVVRATDRPKRPLPASPAKMPITPEQFEGMAEGGLLPQRAELMDGEIYVMPPDGNDHSVGTMDLRDELRAMWPKPKFARCQSTHRFADGWEPMPDIALLDERPVRGAAVDPLPRLVVEVSDTSLSFDLNEKKLRYARNGVPEYWAADLQRRRILIFRDPIRNAASAAEAWRTEIIVAADGVVSPLCIPDLSIKVADVLPEPPTDAAE